MAIYTKNGDKGETSTFTKRRISKSSKLISTIGAVDEFNTFLGIIGGLTDIQKNLFTINAILAGGKIKFDNGHIKKLEKEIDKWEAKLPKLQNFIIYGGSKKASELFYARALCRRAERLLVSCKKCKNPDIFSYINRLSDYLFMLARYENYKSKNKEIIWKK